METEKLMDDVGNAQDTPPVGNWAHDVKIAMKVLVNELLDGVGQIKTALEEFGAELEKL